MSTQNSKSTNFRQGDLFGGGDHHISPHTAGAVDPVAPRAAADSEQTASEIVAEPDLPAAKLGSQPLKKHGGKFYQADRIHALAPPSVHDDPVHGYTHRNIVFAGGLGEFWNWQPVEGIAETVNDIDEELINFYAVLRQPEMFSEFQILAELTKFSDTEFNRAVEAQMAVNGTQQSDVQRAVNMFVRCRMSRQAIGRDYATPTTRTRRGMHEHVSAYLSAVEGLPECHQRLRRVETRNMDFRDFIRRYDHPRALLHLDPPYLFSTRTSTGEYGKHEMSIEDHRVLLQILAGVQGKFMLHGYPSEMYDSWAADHGWRCDAIEIDNKAASSQTKPKRTECVWMNY